MCWRYVHLAPALRSPYKLPTCSHMRTHTCQCCSCPRPTGLGISRASAPCRTCLCQCGGEVHDFIAQHHAAPGICTELTCLTSQCSIIINASGENISISSQGRAMHGSCCDLCDLHPTKRSAHYNSKLIQRPLPGSRGKLTYNTSEIQKATDLIFLG